MKKEKKKPIKTKGNENEKGKWLDKLERTEERLCVCWVS